MPCSNCRALKVLARGLCGACYHRLRRSGSVVRQNVRNAGMQCSASGCTESAHAKGLCSLHYARQMHPLRNTWKTIRSRYPKMTPSRWQRFEKFLDDIGQRPSSRHQLRRLDDRRPYSKNNCCWVNPVLKASKDSYTPQERALYVRDWTLRRKFGITAEQYGLLLKKQRDTCAICHEAECFTNPKTKMRQALSVDHNHRTGAVRGLLCVRCNRMLGYSRDDKTILGRAIAYLEAHR
jgi:hypothetical protein